MVVFSFGERAPEGGYQASFTLAQYANLPARAAAYWNTLALAPAGAFLCLLVAYPAAYYLAVKADPRYRLMLVSLVVVPFWTSLLVRTYAWMYILGSRGIPNLLDMIGIENVRLLNTPGAVLLGIVYGYLPLMIMPIYVSLEKLDRRLLEASADLGAKPVSTFFSVTLPLSLPGVMTGVALVTILLLTGFINLIGALAYAARIAGVRTRRIAMSFALFNILVLFSRTSNSFLGPFLAKRIETRIHDGSGETPIQPASRRAVSSVVLENGGDGASADILCGRFLLGAVPDRLLRDHLPGRLIVRSANAGNARGDAGESTQSTANSRLTRLIELMREEATDDGPGSETLVSHLSAALFALTLRFASELSAPPHGLLALAGRPRLQAAVSAMFETPGEPWTLDQLASLCNMSRATFVRQFQEAIGRSATDVLTEVRMTIAGRALLQSATPVAEIGEAVGYQSEAAFQRVFKRQIGVTPARWRSSGGNIRPE